MLFESEGADGEVWVVLVEAELIQVQERPQDQVPEVVCSQPEANDDEQLRCPSGGDKSVEGDGDNAGEIHKDNIEL